VEWHLTATGYGKVPNCSCDPALIHRIRLLWNSNRFRAEAGATKEHLMLDVLMLALGLGFFVAAVGYTYACERL
jgi:hypothetical protein